MERNLAVDVCTLILGILLVGCGANFDGSPECELDAHCVDTVCNDHRCVDCREDADCDIGLLCSQNLCVDTATFECFADAECPSTTLCRERVCVPTCESAADCSSGSCDAGVCAGCTLDSECGDGTCTALTCHRSCEADVECRPEQRCVAGRCAAACDDTSTDTCLDLFFERADFGEGLPLPLPRLGEEGCQMSGESIAAGLCDGSDRRERPRSCDPCLGSLGGCLGTCEGGECLCEDSENCPDGRVCIEGTCAPCMVSEECGCGQFCSYGICHDACVDDDSCAAGLSCIGGLCTECGGGLSCPEGARCYEDGCVEPCTPDPQCSPAGRSSFCDTFEPFDEIQARQCE